MLVEMRELLQEKQAAMLEKEVSGTLCRQDLEMHGYAFVGVVFVRELGKNP